MATVKTRRAKAPTPELTRKAFDQELERLQRELVLMQEYIRERGLKVVVIFEGRDAAGKGGVIKRITERLNPRVCRVVALATPTEREKTQWYFQRYVAHLPAAGEMVLFDRSWYNRAGVERVMGFCTEEEYAEFMRSCPEFERMLVRSGIMLIKYWFSVSDDGAGEALPGPPRRPDQALEAQPHGPGVARPLGRVLEGPRTRCSRHTDIKQAPWYVVNADDKKRARLNCIHHLLSMIPYEDLTPPPVKLTRRQSEGNYVRPPITSQTFVPETY